MRAACKSGLVILAFLLSSALPVLAQSNVAATAESGESSPGSGPQVVNVDGIAAHIGDDVVTESEVRQLEDYQRLIDGKPQPRAQVLQDLIDQWVVKAEAAAAKFPAPSASDVSAEFRTILKQFPSTHAFQQRLAAVGLTQPELNEIITQQIFYVSFINYKFRSAVQVSLSQINGYYKSQLSPQLQSHGATVPPLSQVETQIRQLLTQEEINEKAAQWLADAKSKLKILIQPLGGGG